MFGKKKQKEHEYSGFMGDTSPEQDAVFNEFKEWVASSGTGDMEAMHFDDYDLLRFCRARKFVIADVQLMWTNFINWRKDESVESIIETFTFDEIDQVNEVYPHGYHKTDRQGRPIYIERFGLINVEALWRVTTEERMVKHFIQAFEQLMKV